MDISRFALAEDGPVWRILLRLICLVLAVQPAFVAAQSTVKSSKVDFDRDIRPIRSGKCFACHGQDPLKDRDEEERRLRLDRRDDAVNKGAIVPGKPDESELVRRIHHKLDRKRMPPPTSNKSLTEREK